MQCDDARDADHARAAKGRQAAFFLVATGTPGGAAR
jgi:hypothetical protein